jgi:hypothetical protein
MPFLGRWDADARRARTEGWKHHWTVSAPIAVYRSQAEVFGGRSDGKFVVRFGKVEQSQVLTSAGDN